MEGEAASGFERVIDAFAANLSDGSELGGAFAAHVGGRKVVDVWGGRRTSAAEEPYPGDGLQLIFSATKGLTALCIQTLVAEGHLDVDAPVAKYWPEFAQAGKDQIPVRYLLCHQAGLPTIDVVLTPEEVFRGEPVTQALAAMAPIWEPGTAYGYHALTYGWLVGEVFRRAAGETVGQFLRRRFVEPLGLDMWLGTPAEIDERVVSMEMGPDMVDAPGVDPECLMVRAGTLNHSLPSIPNWVNEPEHWRPELPAGNAICDARSLSRLYAAVIGPVDGHPGCLLPTELIAEASRNLSEGLDVVFGSAGLPVDIRFGQGFFVHGPGFPFGSPRSFGHPGASGALGFADPEHGVACGYVTNTMTPAPPDPRSVALVEAVYESLGA